MSQEYQHRDFNDLSSNSQQEALRNFKNRQKKDISVTALFEGIKNGNNTSLSQGITLVESTQVSHNEKAQQLIEKCLPLANKSIRIGITGVPGVGKSTFIEALGQYLIKEGKRVAVLAIDPSSTVSKGSILGDKTRMEQLVRSENAFIRPSPAGTSLGGVAQKTRESIILCEAAGYDTIIIETVGVGQSETAVHSMVDFFLLLKLAGAGDELQGIKRGIIEMADSIVINKADGDNKKKALEAKSQFRKALHLFPLTKNKWQPEVLVCSALQNEGIHEIWNLILSYVSLTKENGYFETNRNNQNEYWLLQTIDEQLKKKFYENVEIKKELPIVIQSILQNKMTPFHAASYLLELYKKM